MPNDTHDKSGDEFNTMIDIIFSISFLSHENPQAWAPELETASNGSYTKGKKCRSNLISATLISSFGFDYSPSFHFKTMKTVILSVLLVVEVWLDWFSCDSHFTSDHVN